MTFTPELDGNCQFSAAANLLNVHANLNLSVSELREKVIQFLSNSPCLLDGSPLELADFVDNYGIVKYLKNMASAGQYGDHITLLGMCCLYKVQFVVLSSLGTSTIVSPHRDSRFVPGLPLLLIGHYAETLPVYGKHYVSLEAVSGDAVKEILRNCSIVSREGTDSTVSTSSGASRESKAVDGVVRSSQPVSSSISQSLSHEQCPPGFTADISRTDVRLRETCDSVPSERSTRTAYIDMGPIQPRLSSYPSRKFGRKNRKFNSGWFDRFKWLEYSVRADRVFCFPCRVFGKNSEHDLHSVPFQSGGFCDWKNATEYNHGLPKHERCGEHMKNAQAWQEYKTAKPIDAQLDRQRAYQLQAAKLERSERFDASSTIIDVAVTLARLRLPFRGHDETCDSTNRGVFREIIDLLSRYHAPLHNHIVKSSQNPKGYPSYLSAESQNDIIHCAASAIRERIISEVQKAKYFSVCMDTTPDESRTDQLSIIVRYVHVDGFPKEALLSLSAAPKGDGETLYNLLLTTLSRYNLDFRKIRGQGYDGCSSMTGQYRGVKSRLLEVNSRAYFVHCYAHRLNLVIVDTVSKNTLSRNFFGVVGQLYAFIEGSAKRHGLFRTVQQQLQEEDTVSTDERIYTLHSLSATRWSCRADNCVTLVKVLPAVKATLEHIVDDDLYDRETGANALSLLKCIDFQFCLVLCVMADILSEAQVVSKYLQSDTMNVAAASLAVEGLLASIQAKRSESAFAKFWDAAVTMGHSIAIEYNEPRTRKVSRRLDDLWANEATITGRDQLRTTFFYVSLDLMTSALIDRYSSQTLPLLKSVASLHSPELSKVDELLTLATFYEGDISMKYLKEEYSLMNRCLQQSSEPVKGLSAMYSWLLQSDISSMCPSVTELYKLVLTLPATSCSNERSFSVLKFVKNRLRTTMGQIRLEDLMILAVEAEQTQNLDLNHIRDLFWNMADRR